MFALFFFGVALVGAVVTIVVRKLKGVARINMLADWLLGVSVGLGGVWAFVGHAVFTERVAASIGWAASPFQWEIAVSNLAIGVLGLLSLVFRDRFRLAAAIACNVYLLGCAAGHIHQALAYHNYAINNIGPVLWISDITVPLLTLALVIAGDVKGRRSAAQ
ncbi:MAG TPA: hypothetical protein PLT64_08040 [Syntrophales bacterium]|nr:hypothetical protein [Syntrophales bacterium]HPO35897.1 hypothetical protein [Syntrophales bacterium]